MIDNFWFEQASSSLSIEHHVLQMTRERFTEQPKDIQHMENFRITTRTSLQFPTHDS